MAKVSDKEAAGSIDRVDSKSMQSLRQAVVVIHGMGEQRPMETLRWFVDGVLPGKSSSGHKENPEQGGGSADVSEQDAGSAVSKRDVTSDKITMADRIFGANPGKSTEDYWIVPDGRTGSHELSRIRAKPVTNQNGQTFRTDFYELYYADELTGNTLQHLLGWVRGLMFRWPHQLPKKQVWLWLMLWAIALFSILLLGPELANSPLQRLGEFFKSGNHTQGTWALFISTAGAVLGAWYAVAQVRSHIDHHGEDESHETYKSGFSFALAIAGPVVLAILAYYFLPWNAMGPGNDALDAAAKTNPFAYPFVVFWNWPLMKIAVAALLYVAIYQFGIPVFGDVARYVEATPASIGSREKIRLRGISLLSALHDAKVKDAAGNDTDVHEYDRIVIAAHSLGSIVAMDVLRLFWAQRGPGQGMDLDAGSIAALEAVDLYSDAKGHKEGRLDPELDLSNDDENKDFFSLQRRAGMALAAGASRWRITDFLTMGSPLAHSEFLIARDPPRLAQMIKERIIPQSPPILEKPGKTNSGKWSFLYAPSRGGSTRPHHAAMFACVRWTALYDPRRYLFLGDFIGGPLKRNFGPGIAEVPVRIKRGGGLLPRLVTHNDYWNPKANGTLVDKEGNELSSNPKLPTELANLGSSRFAHIDALRAILFSKTV